ncbi:hypothetical protein [Streptomyces rochei]|uniref:hypothetical protein n=1 Tax=Streptomyces rochei TaxID=1928 RepID=UPI0036796CC5
MGEENGLPQVVEPLLDLHLQMLIKFVEQSDANRVPVTLNVPGTVIFGQLASPSAWSTRWVERIGAMVGDGKEHLSFLPDQTRQAVDELMKEQGGEEPRILPRWVHLLDARMVTGAMNTMVDVPLWRGRLADVSGWSIGVPD